MKVFVKRLLCSESGQGAVEYIFVGLLFVTLALIGFVVVPYFSEGFDVLLDRILENNYQPGGKSGGQA